MDKSPRSKEKECRRIKESLKNSEAGKQMALDNMTEEEIWSQMPINWDANKIQDELKKKFWEDSGTGIPWKYKWQRGGGRKWSYKDWLKVCMLSS